MRKRPLPVRQGETAPRERGGLTQEAVARVAGGRVLVLRQRVKAECALDAYFLRGWISATQHAAGMKFRKAYLRAVCNVAVDDGGVGAHGDRECRALMLPISAEILAQAYEVLTQAQRDVTINVAGHDGWAGSRARCCTLRRALDILARRWGID